MSPKKSSSFACLARAPIAAAALLASLFAGPALADAAPPPVSAYLGQQNREIKALSADEVKALLAGKGAGLARAAELNGYPGPNHVLELALPLALSADQRARTEALFAAMDAKAKTLGQGLVEAERHLDRLFASKAVNQQSLLEALERIGALQTQVRASHLEVHLAQASILSAEQNRLYFQLRGYAAAGPAAQNPSDGMPHKHP